MTPFTDDWYDYLNKVCAELSAAYKGVLCVNKAVHLCNMVNVAARIDHVVIHTSPVLCVRWSNPKGSPLLTVYED